MNKIKKNPLILIGILVFSIGLSSCKKNSNSIKPLTSNDYSIATNAVTQDDLILAENASSDYVILLSETAGSVEKYAADFLNSTLKSASGASLTIKTEAEYKPNNTKEYVISIGKTEFFADKCPKDTNINLKDEGFILSLVENSVFVKGGDDMGTLYGTQEFLKYVIGFEAYSPEEVYYNLNEYVPMRAFGTKVVNPTFDTRGPGHGSLRSPTDAALMRCVASGIDKASSLTGKNWGACAHTIPSYAGGHPEWFNNGQLCMSIPEAVDQVAERVAADILKGQEKWFELGHADTSASCDCLDCTESANKNGGQGGVFVLWLNQVAKKIESILATKHWEKEWYIVGLAYQAYVAAPVSYDKETNTYKPLNSEVIANEHVGIRCAPIGACYAHSFNDARCSTNVQQDVRRQLEGWGAITDNMWTWLYDTEFTNYVYFYDDFGAIAENAKYLEKAGVTNIASQMTSCEHEPFGALRVYLMSKLWWDNTLDYNTLVEKFFEHYYKEAAPYMKEYFDAIRANRTLKSAENGTGGCYVYHSQSTSFIAPSNWPFPLLKQYEQIIEKAYKVIRESSRSAEQKEELRMRVRADEMFIEHYFVTDYAIRFTTEEYSKMSAQYYADHKLLGNNSLSE